MQKPDRRFAWNDPQAKKPTRRKPLITDPDSNMWHLYTTILCAIIGLIATAISCGG